MMRIDAHQHFWYFNRLEYSWINDDMEVLRQDFTPAHAFDMIKLNSVDFIIAVQARQSLEETEQLLNFAEEYPFIAAVTGWVPLCSETLQNCLERFCLNKKFKAVRHVIQDEHNDEFIMEENFNRGIAMLQRYNLAYEILVYEKQLPLTIEFLKKHQEQIFILDHIGKPEIRNGSYKEWASNIKKLARNRYLFCKLSGMLTEADIYRWEKDDLSQYFEIVLNEFGAERIIWGSDWPVLKIASTYEQWIEIVSAQISSLSASEQNKIMYENACIAYSLQERL